MDNLFISIDKHHRISLIPITNDIIIFELQKFDIEYVKTFVLLLKECIEYIQLKKFKNIYQYINIDEFKLFKYSKIIDGMININYYIIEIPIDKLMPELYQLLDIQIL